MISFSTILLKLKEVFVLKTSPFYQIDLILMFAKDMYYMLMSEKEEFFKKAFVLLI